MSSRPTSKINRAFCESVILLKQVRKDQENLQWEKAEVENLKRDRAIDRERMVKLEERIQRLERIIGYILPLYSSLYQK